MWFDTFINCKMITTMASYHIITISFFFLVERFKIYLLSNIQVYDTVLLAIITILYIWSPELVYLKIGSLYPLTTISPFSPSNYHFTLFFWNSQSSWGQFLYEALQASSSCSNSILNVPILILLGYFSLHSNCLSGYFSQKNFSSLKAEWDFKKYLLILSFKYLSAIQ